MNASIANLDAMAGFSAPICSESLLERLNAALAEIERLKPLAAWALEEKEKRRRRHKNWPPTPEARREYERRRRERDREIRRIRDRIYRKNNLAKVKLKDQRYRARKKHERLQLSMYELKSKLG